MLQWKSADLSAHKAVPPVPVPEAASPAKTTKPFGRLVFGNQRAKDAVAVTKSAPFVIPISAVSRPARANAQGAVKPLAFKFAMEGGKGKPSLPFGKSMPTQQPARVAPPSKRFPSPPVHTGFTSRSTTIKPATKLPQVFSWGGSATRSKPAPAAPLFTGFRPYVPKPCSTTPTNPDYRLRKIPLIPTLLTPTSASAAKKAAPHEQFVAAESVALQQMSVKRAPRDESSQVVYSRPAKRPKRRTQNDLPSSGISPRLTAQTRLPQAVRAEGLCTTTSSEEDQINNQKPNTSPAQDNCIAMATRFISGENVTSDVSLPVDTEAPYKLGLASEITLISLSLNTSEDEEFLEQIQKMHIEIEQSQREDQGARDRLLQTHADLSESLLDAINDLIAESSGCGLDQLSIDDDASDSIDTDTPSFHTVMPTEHPCATTSSA